MSQSLAPTHPTADLPARLVARLRRTMMRNLASPIPEPHLRRFFHILGREAVARGLAVERILAIMASLWNTMPELGATSERQLRADARARLVSICIDEFYTPAEAQPRLAGS